MIPIRIKDANAVLGRDQEGVSALHVHFDGTWLSSAWQPTPSELAALNSGANVKLGVLGTAHPGVMLTVDTAPQRTPPLAPADCPLCRSARPQRAAPDAEAMRKARLALLAAIGALKRVQDGKAAYANDTVFKVAIRDFETAYDGIKL